MAQLVTTTGISADLHSAGGAIDPPAVGTAANNTLRIILKFDTTVLSAIPSTATITAVSVAIKEYDVFADNAATDWTIQFRRIIREPVWGNGAPNWLTANYGGSVNWATPGCGLDGTDRSATISASFAQNKNDVEATRTYSGAGLVADLQYWIADISNLNFGWLLQAPLAETGSGYSYSELWGPEAPIAGNRPILTVDYSLSTPVTVSRLFHVW